VPKVQGISYQSLVLTVSKYERRKIRQLTDQAKMDKNSLWAEANVRGINLCVKRRLPQVMGVRKLKHKLRDGSDVVIISSETNQSERLFALSNLVFNGKVWLFNQRLPSLAAMERSRIAVKCKALLDAPFYPTISRAT
jgi:hypothetical protein